MKRVHRQTSEIDLDSNPRRGLRLPPPGCPAKREATWGVGGPDCSTTLTRLRRDCASFWLSPPEPFQGSSRLLVLLRVARSSQPWVLGQNPFGICQVALIAAVIWAALALSGCSQQAS